MDRGFNRVSFPLPDGTCRRVCRPNRAVPRQINPKDVARLALAAVKNGYKDCEVMDAVRGVVKCSKCREKIEAVDEGLQALEEDARELLSAILELLGALGIPTKGEEPEKGKTEAWWKKLLKAINLATKIRDFVEAVLKIYEGLLALNETVTRLIADVRELMKCCSEV